MSARCPITYEALDDGQVYSAAGLRRLHPKLQSLQTLPFSPDLLLQEAAARAARMSIQGVQPKLSAVLRLSEERIDLVDTGGRFILKPPNPAYPDVPENEDLTLKLAVQYGLEVPDHGLLWANHRALVFWIRRFDRHGRNQRRPVEDFAQLAGLSRDTKYDFSVEKLIGVIEQFCTFAQIEKAEFFRRFCFNWVVGNDDMHLKNYSIWQARGIHKLAPCYDFLSTHLVLREPSESALPLDGKRAGFTRQLLVDYLGRERCGLNRVIVEETLAKLIDALSLWRTTIAASFLGEKDQARYLELIERRLETLRAGG
ncbi:MAG: type II toxin-antitoxin system HipA family toxin [Opitutales bacterium]